MIGNAVPPPLSKALGDELLKVLLISNLQKETGSSIMANTDRSVTSSPKRGSDSTQSFSMTRGALLEMGSSTKNAILLEED